MNKTKDTRTLLLDTAQDMLQRQSVSGISFQELAKRVGIKKGSVYYHFETKDDLAITLLERTTNEMNDSFSQGKNKTPEQQLKYFFNIYQLHIIPSEKMCPGGAFAGEWEKVSDPVRKQVNRLINTQIKGLDKILADGIAKGQFKSHGQSTHDLAQWIMSSLQGALLTSRISGSKEGFTSMLNIITQHLHIED